MSYCFVNASSDGYVPCALSMYSGQFEKLMWSPAVAGSKLAAGAAFVPPGVLDLEHAARIEARLNVPTEAPPSLIMFLRDSRRDVMPRASAEDSPGCCCGSMVIRLPPLGRDRLGA